MLTIAGGIVLAVIILAAIPFILVGMGIAVEGVCDGISAFVDWCRNIIKILLSPIARGLIKLFNCLHISEEDWAFALAIMVLIILLVIYLIYSI